MTDPKTANGERALLPPSVRESAEVLVTSLEKRRDNCDGPTWTEVEFLTEESAAACDDLRAALSQSPVAEEASDGIFRMIAKAEFALRWDEAAQRARSNEAVTPEFLHWLQDMAPREGVAANIAWNAGVAYALAAHPAQSPAVGERGPLGISTACPYCENKFTILEAAQPPAAGAEQDAARYRSALQEIAGMTFDPWTNGARAREIAFSAMAVAKEP